MSRGSRLAALALIVLLAACGGGGETTGEEPVDDRTAARQVVERYFAALADGSYEEACGYLGEQALEQLTQFPEYTGDCEGSLAVTFDALPEEELEALRDPQVASVEVSGDTATVQTGARPVPLVRTDDGWKIASLT